MFKRYVPLTLALLHNGKSVQSRSCGTRRAQKQKEFLLTFKIKYTVFTAYGISLHSAHGHRTHKCTYASQLSLPRSDSPYLGCFGSIGNFHGMESFVVLFIETTTS